MISIVIPVYNEEECLENTLQNITRLDCFNECEVILSDGGSTDRTVEKASIYFKTIITKKGKAIQQNAGASQAKGNILFFVHADMTLPQNVLRVIDEKVNVQGYDGGGFLNEFSSYNKRIKTIGRIMNFRIINKEQSERKIFYGDNGIFLKENVFKELGGFKEIPIMEDYDLSKRLKKKYKVVIVDNPKIIVNPRRHIKAGFIKTRLLWIVIRRLYKLGISPFLLRRLYKDIR